MIPPAHLPSFQSHCLQSSPIQIYQLWVWRREGQPPAEHDGGSFTLSLSFYTFCLSISSQSTSASLKLPPSLTPIINSASPLRGSLFLPAAAQSPPLLLLFAIPGLTCHWETLRINEVFSERQPSSQHYNRVRNVITH